VLLGNSLRILAMQSITAMSSGVQSASQSFSCSVMQMSINSVSSLEVMFVSMIISPLQSIDCNQLILL